MTDPVAEAAAKIAADAAPSSTEPTGIIGDIVNEFHKLEEKVEHLIHPETVPNVLPASTSGTPAGSMPSPAVQDAPATDAPAINSPTVEPGNVVAGAGAGEPVAGAALVAGGEEVGIPGIVASSVAEPVSVKPTSLASGNIRSSIAAIKHHLSIRGFEQSAVADIHAELDAIEKWL